jgi:hypothetical protein
MRCTLVMIVILFGMTLPVRGQDSACGIRHLVTIEADGSVSRGSKEQLRRVVENGLSVRVGLQIDANGDGVAEVSHWADAGFLTEFEGEVFAQLADIQRQSPLRGQARVPMPAGRQRWTGLIGTNGTLESHFDDGSEPQAARVRSTWCLDAREACTAGWRMVYRHDADGQPLDGSRQALLAAVRGGAPIRVAWGFSGSNQAGRTVTVEHSADPVFLTIMNGDHVFVQLPEHIGQTSYSQPDRARFDRPSVMWRGLMGSDGTFDAVLVERATGKTVQRMPQRAGLAWFAELPPPECPDRSPLTLAAPGGVRRR